MQVQQQRPESPIVTLTWHACKYKVHKLHQRYILEMFLCYDKGNDKGIGMNTCQALLLIQLKSS